MTPAQAPATAADVDTAASVVAKAQARGRQSRERLVSAFAAEAPAADAANLQAVVLRAVTDPALADLPVLPLSTSVQCRQRLCLLTARFAPGMEPDDWSMRVAMLLAPTFSQSRALNEPSPNGETLALLYLIRPGPEGTQLALEL